MQTTWEDNLSRLYANSHHYIEEMPEQSDLVYQYIGIDAGEEFFTDDKGKVYLVKDEVDRSYEIRPFLRELHVIIGITSVQEISYLIEKSNNNSHFLIIEPNSSLFFMLCNIKK
ncbi:hypothetical protein PP175_23375 [Aneurinibacillus sp. Ricciae_BoGa-3]|uniref:hypothetical protein n=1 Tax=Aneurinibacillus sp. Ricciae_BoGa-3 TaxID=3022697 RepID=UPI002341D180|nr:hypothetical protein [Aneurinibacillus sp. Ricciae_BoGa-3]WCK54194.1 hypothetical protein PP175_23375 [Aneurinibacillus sp. Ricciae_BoGa-3]